MVRQLGGVMVLSILGLCLPGCGGLSKEDAELRCNQEKAAKNQCYTDEVFNACVACFEDCGDECIADATCPATYHCPDSSSTTTGGTGGSGTK